MRNDLVKLPAAAGLIFVGWHFAKIKASDHVGKTEAQIRRFDLKQRVVSIVNALRA